MQDLVSVYFFLQLCLRGTKGANVSGWWGSVQLWFSTERATFPTADLWWLGCYTWKRRFVKTRDSKIAVFFLKLLSLEILIRVPLNLQKETETARASKCYFLIPFRIPLKMSAHLKWWLLLVNIGHNHFSLCSYNRDHCGILFLSEFKAWRPRPLSVWFIVSVSFKWSFTWWMQVWKRTEFMSMG